MTRVDVDFNARGRDGLLRISRRRADGDLSVGDMIEVYDAEDPEMSFAAVVDSLDDNGVGLARVEWEPVPAVDLRAAYLARSGLYWRGAVAKYTTATASTGDLKKMNTPVVAGQNLVPSP